MRRFSAIFNRHTTFSILACTVMGLAATPAKAEPGFTITGNNVNLGWCYSGAGPVYQTAHCYWDPTNGQCFQIVSTWTNNTPPETTEVPIEASTVDQCRSNCQADCYVSNDTWFFPLVITP